MDLSGFDVHACDLKAFRHLTEQVLPGSRLDFAAGVEKNVPIYDISQLGQALTDPQMRKALLSEWGQVLSALSGVLVLKTAYADTSVLDEASDVFETIIARENAAGGTQADHFATAGANDRIWNALQKLCEEDARLYARYFGNPAISAVCEAWLGPHYQMTAQINVVRPGGQAQQAHRDYHLGFQSADVAGQFPPHAHILSAALTLQGAIAHCDMPVESGPTKLLPFSQLYPQGYMAYRRDDFRAYFDDHYIQLPLAKGDAVFFNPALFHAAGENRSADIERMANLLQVSSAFGRAMEAIDREAMCRKLYPVLQSLIGSNRMTADEAEAAINATAEGYAFPTNLDTDPPTGGLAPQTQAHLFGEALRAGMDPASFSAALAQHTARRAP